MTIPPRHTYIDLDTDPDRAKAFLEGVLTAARVTTIEQVADMSLKELDWQYAPGWNSVGALLAHVIAIENLFRITELENRKLTKDEALRWLPGVELGEHVSKLRGKRIGVYLKELAKARELTLQGLDALSSEDLGRCRTGQFHPDGYNVAWVLYHHVEDEVHHRGQISLLRKLYTHIHGHN